MAEVTLRRCDVFETLTKEVGPVSVVMIGPDQKELFSAAVDMSPRAIKRAVKFLDRATTPPPKEPKEQAPDA